MPLLLSILLVFTFKDAAGDASDDDRISINCGSSSPSPSIGDKQWMADVYPVFSSSAVTVKGISSRTSLSKQPTVDPVPYTTARISTSQFSYHFRLNPGQKYIRLHFSPNSYKFISVFHKKKLEDCFSVEAGPFTLLANFSASITARALGRNFVTKEFCVDVQESTDFRLVFTPSVAANPSQGFYAFVNGIEIISAPSSLSYCNDGNAGVQIVGQKSVVFIDNSIALEMAYRLDVKRDFVPSGAGGDNFGMFRLRERAKSARFNTWKVSVDVGFRYLIVLHFCEIGLQIAKNGSRDFMILINGTIVVTNADLAQRRDGEGILWYKSYMVTVNGNKHEGKRDILISLHSNDELMDRYGPLEGFEVFKLSNPDNSLASPNPLPPTGDSLSLTTQSFLAALGSTHVLIAVVIMLICLVNIVVHKLQRGCEVNLPEEENMLLTRAKNLCRQFSLSEIRFATDDFFDALVIGRGGFGKVYMGRIDNGKQTVAIKRLKSSSNQGKREFQTEVELLSEVRHVNVVSLVGYCIEKGEMILVYEHVPCGSLAENLHKLSMKSNTSSLSWTRRLEICIGAGRGLDYLHTGHGIIHRDIKSSNILLDANFVPKVSDFGLAKIHTGQSQASTNFKGTFGYFDPDYFRTRRLTMKSDTYSFGVVLLEVLCGRPAVEPLAEEDKRSLTMWARDKISKGEVDDIVAASLRDEISTSSLKAFVRIVERCLADEPKNRPAVSHVIINLEFALEQQVKANSSKPNEKAGLADVLPLIDTIQPKNASPNEIENVPVPQQGNAKSYLPNEVENDSDATTSTDLFGQTKAKPFLTTQLKVVSTNKQMATSSNMKKVTHPLKMVKTTIRKVVGLWSWDAMLKDGKTSKRKESIGSISAPVTFKTVRPKYSTPSEYRNGGELLLTPNLKIFSFKELKDITRNFRPDTYLGGGGFGEVYKGLLKENGTESTVAIKMLSSNSKQGFTEWQSEVNFLGRLSHPNVVKLIGYCIEDKGLLLVYEFMSKGSLENHLFRQNVRPLPWDIRLQILIGAARGLSFLHKLERIVIYRDFKASNILLDGSYHAKLSDFGLAKFGPPAGESHVSTRIIGTYGYTAPEYVATGHFYVKSDMYGFGVVLLEVLTGLQVFDKKRPSGQKNLVDWVKPYLHNREKLIGVIDPRLKGMYPRKDVFQLARLAQNCLEHEPKKRPSAQEVVEVLERIQSL